MPRNKEQSLSPENILSLALAAGFSSEKPQLEKVWGGFSLPESIMDVIAPKGDIGLSPMPVSAGMVVSERNLPILARKALEGVDDSWSNAKIALQYLSIKYPKLFSKLAELPSGQKQAFVVNKLANGDLGTYYSGNPAIRMVEHPTVGQAVETGGHELTHLWQDLRGTLPSAENYISSGPGYMQQVAEQQAFKGGATARETYEYFREMLKQKLYDVYSQFGSLK